MNIFMIIDEKSWEWKKIHTFSDKESYFTTTVFNATLVYTIRLDVQESVKTTLTSSEMSFNVPTLWQGSGLSDRQANTAALRCISPSLCVKINTLWKALSKLRPVLRSVYTMTQNRHLTSGFISEMWQVWGSDDKQSKTTPKDTEQTW